MENYNRFLGEDEVAQYVKVESQEERFEAIYESFVENDVATFKKQINEMNSNDFAKFMIHILESMCVDPREVVRTLKSIVD